MTVARSGMVEQSSVSDGFAVAALDVARALGAGLREVVEQISSDQVRTGPEFASIFEIDDNLAWKLLSIAKPGTSPDVLQKVPGESGMRTFFRAAQRKGASDKSIARVRAAMVAYQSLIDTHAGDRAGLDSLLSNLNGAERTSDVGTRRAAFRANSSLLGVQADVQVSAYFFWPEQHADGNTTSAMAILRGYGGFRRLRSDVAWILGRGRRTDHKGRAYGQAFPQPVDAEMAELHGGVPLVRLFSSDKMPPVRRTIMPDGMAVDRLLPGPVGRQASLTFFLAETMRPGLAEANDPDNPSLRLVTSTHTPCEQLVCDAFFHKDLPPLGAISCVTGSELGGVSLGHCDPCDRVKLYMGAEIEDHGQGVETLHIDNLPRYPELLGNMCRRQGINPDDLRSYRVKVDYPPVASAVMFERAMLAH